ncbi:OB-fold domain-containing protein [Sphingobium sp. V4]|uniref:Zn-ribbon domain-containing OB-fold protein n=1 Tax=Sphingobium sp. V4 TaxID=3038927 RepID=UPI0025582FE5|nr:OB-fold domain-containing protein [Sphingobium sp. V4]WIW89508.1 OB-fold domain-containing protein [Sphingobium sp. V4]
MSGRGRIYSYTQTVTGARHPAFAKVTPYLVGLVELVEQDELFLYTNFPGATIEDLRVGKAVEVVFEKGPDDLAMPQFRLVAEDPS